VNSSTTKQRIEENKITWKLECRLDSEFRDSSRTDTSTDRTLIICPSLQALEQF
jgi:hypothetical protein